MSRAEMSKGVDLATGIMQLARQKGSSLTPEEFRIQTEAASRCEFARLRQSRVEQTQAAMEEAIRRAGVPPKFQGKRFDSYVTDTAEQARVLSLCRRYADDFDSLSRGGVDLILTGTPGTGKTHLAIAVLEQVMREGRSGLFTSVSEMLRMIRSTYSPRATMSELEAFDVYIKPDLLVLDEIGVSIGDAEKRKATTFDILNARYIALKPTVLMGNLTQQKMQEYLGPRIWDRLMEGGSPVLALDWESYRSKKK